jgi:hypothetical protein
MNRIPLLTIVLVALATSLAACGGDDPSSSKPAAGTPENPLVGTNPEVASGQLGNSNEGTAGVRSDSKQQPAAGSNGSNGSNKGSGTAASGEPSGTGNDAPGYSTLLKRQSKHPKSRFSPCNLVTESQAQSILGAAVQQPLEAPQGPTCIYRTRTGKAFVSVAVQTSTPYEQLRRLVRKRQAVTVSGREGVCGNVGQPTLFLRLSGGRVLTIAADCEIAKQFAIRAVPAL